MNDTGNEIPEDERERSFDRFDRVDKSHSKETGGTGLGLSIVKHGAVIHNIQIRTDSEVGKGTTITLSFLKIFPTISKSKLQIKNHNMFHA